MSEVVTSSVSPVPPGPGSLGERLALFARDIKVSHSVFALPWAVLATFMAWDEVGRGELLGKLGLIVVCMVTARTVAMSANRILDAEIDKRNPRTAGRAIPSGKLTEAFFTVALVTSGGIFIAACAMFWFLFDNGWPLTLAVPVLLFVSAYPLLKRFSRLCHYYLGAALALAPVCAWIAVAGELAWPPVIMAVAVLAWTAGFDIIYACQDYASDMEHGVHSVPAKYGIARALWISRATHLVCVAALVALGWYAFQLSTLYFVGVGIAVALLVIEHALVRPDDLSKVGLAFFTVNGVISLVLGALGVVDVFV